MKHATCKNSLMLTGMMTLAAAVALAQGAAQPPSTKGAVIKGKAPVNKELLKVKFPKAYESTLSNGLRVVALESHKIPTFSMSMIIQSGGLSDPAEQIGAAQLTASLLREGTKTRNSKQIAEQVDMLGAGLFANAGMFSPTSIVSTSGLTENFDKIMELFADVILNPSFPADEFNKLKQRSLAGLRQQRSNPGFLAGERFAKVMYANHPAARQMTAADLQKLTPEALQKFHATFYKPNNAMFTIVGDVKPADVVAKLEKAFAGWAKGDVTPATYPAVAEVGASKIYLVDRPNSVQTNLVLGTQTVTRTDPDYFPLVVMNNVLGGGGSARLFLNLREDKGYTYGAYSSFSAPRYRGTLQASAQVKTEVTDGSMKEFLYELNRIRDEKVSAKELEDAKRAIVGGFALELESPQSLLNNIEIIKLYGLPDDYWDTYPQKIAAVTADDIQRVARKYINLEKLQIIAVGDGSKIADVLKKYGTVEMYDTEGKPKTGATAALPASK